MHAARRSAVGTCRYSFGPWVVRSRGLGLLGGGRPGLARPIRWEVDVELKQQDGPGALVLDPAEQLLQDPERRRHGAARAPPADANSEDLDGEAPATRHGVPIAPATASTCSGRSGLPLSSMSTMHRARGTAGRSDRFDRGQSCEGAVVVQRRHDVGCPHLGDPARCVARAASASCERTTLSRRWPVPPRPSRRATSLDPDRSARRSSREPSSPC